MSKSALIEVTAQPKYIKEESDPGQQKFIWSYEISITNNSDEVIQLLNRYWLVTDMAGKMEEIRGPGVIGLQPIIKPGKQFTYTSYCQLMMPQGTMEGHYEMQNLKEEYFLAQVPKFVLSAPASVVNPFRSILH